MDRGNLLLVHQVSATRQRLISVQEAYGIMVSWQAFSLPALHTRGRGCIVQRARAIMRGVAVCQGPCPMWRLCVLLGVWCMYRIHGVMCHMACGVSS